jgi:hypothetical protein
MLSELEAAVLAGPPRAMFKDDIAPEGDVPRSAEHVM